MIYTLYFLLFVSVIAVSLKFYQDTLVLESRPNYMYIVFAAAVMLMIFVTRDFRVSSDGLRYEEHFVAIRNMEFREVLTEYLFNPNYLFWYLNWFAARARLGFEAFCVIVNILTLCIYAYGIFKLQQKYNFTYVYLLLIAFCSHDFFLYNSNALRQGMAMAFLPVFIYMMSGRKYLRSLLLAVIAFFFHTSGILLVLIFLIALLTRGRKKIIFFLLILCIAVGFYLLKIVSMVNIPLLSKRLALIMDNQTAENMMIKLVPILLGSIYLVWKYDPEYHNLFVVPIAICGFICLFYRIPEASSRFMGFWYYSAAFALMQVAEDKKYLYHLCLFFLIFVYLMYVITHNSVLMQFVNGI